MYDAKGNLLSEEDPSGNKTTYEYDSFGQLGSETDPRGNKSGANPDDYKTLYENYDPTGNPKKITDPDGTVTRLVYDTTGNLTKITDPLNHVTETVFDANGNATAVIDGEGNKTTHTYDLANRQIKTVSPLGNAVLGPDGLLNNPADLSQYTTTLDYYADDQLKKITNALGETTELAYDSNGNLSVETDPRGYVTTMHSNLANQLWKEELPGGATILHEYDALKQPKKSTGPNGEVQYKYDAAGRILSILGPRTDAQGQPYKTTFTYDNAGNRLTTTTPGEHVSGVTGSYTTVQTYYDNRLPWTVTDPGGNKTTYTYDAAGNPQTITDPTDVVREFEYDAMDRLTREEVLGSKHTETTGSVSLGTPVEITVTPAIAGSISAALSWADLSADLDLQLIDPAASGAVLAEGEHTDRPESLVYHGAVKDKAYKLRITAKAALPTNFTLDYSLPIMQVRTRTYDAAGRLDTLTDAAGVTDFDYDDADQLTSTTFEGDSSTSSDDVVHTIEYYADGQVKKRTDPTGEMIFTISKAGLLEKVKDQGLVESTYDYDDAGNVEKVTRPSSGSFESTWDPENRLKTRKVLGASSSAGFTYGDKAYRTEVTAAVGDVDARTFDPEGHMLTLLLKSGSGTAAPTRASYTYAYDAQGNQSTTVGNTTGISAELARYTYDTMDRLTKESFLVAGAIPRTVEYEYAGQPGRLDNRTAMKEGTATTTYEYNPAGQLLALARTDVLGATTSYFYDTVGNLEKAVSPQGATEYEWTAAGYLKKVSGPTGTVSFTYDSEGKRMTKTVGTTITTSSYERGNVVSESTPGAGSVRYTYDDIGAPLTITLPSGATYTYHYDAGGSVIELTDASHATVAGYTYDAWGNVVDSFGPEELRNANPYTYRGEFGVRFDRQTGLYLMGERYYDPVLGRFLSRDPIESDPSQSAYVYGDANPVAKVDPNGMESDWLRRYQKKVRCGITRKCRSFMKWYLKGWIERPFRFPYKPDEKMTKAGWRALDAYRPELVCSSQRSVPWYLGFVGSKRVGPGNTGRSFNFTHACQTHDYGYDLLRFFGSRGKARREVDELFKYDTRADCRSRGWFNKRTCRGAAWSFYNVVSLVSRLQNYKTPSGRIDGYGIYSCECFT